MKTKTIGLIILMMCLSFGCAKQQFVKSENITVEKVVDEMTDEVLFKINIESTNKEAVLSVYRDEVSYKIDLLLPESSNKIEASLTDFGYYTADSTIRFDKKDRVETILYVSKTLRFASFSPGEEFTTKIVEELTSSEQLLIQVPVFTRSQKLYKFDIVGFNYAFDEVQKLLKRERKKLF